MPLYLFSKVWSLVWFDWTQWPIHWWSSKSCFWGVRLESHQKDWLSLADLSKIDWWCLYYSIRNDPVALLEALFARVVFLYLRSRCAVIFSFGECVCVCVCVCVLGLCPEQRNPLPPLPTWARLLCLLDAILLVCLSYMCACACVPLYVRVKMCNQSDKYQQISANFSDRDDITCNVKVETEIDGHTARSRKDETWNFCRNVNRNPRLGLGCSSRNSFQTAHLKREMTFDHRGFGFPFRQPFRVSSFRERAVVTENRQSVEWEDFKLTEYKLKKSNTTNMSVLLDSEGHIIGKDLVFLSKFLSAQKWRNRNVAEHTCSKM